MATTAFDVERVRARFSALRQPFAFLDAPGGTQVPDEVGQAMADAVRDASGNTRRAVRDEPRRRGDPRAARERRAPASSARRSTRSSSGRT